MATKFFKVAPINYLRRLEFWKDSWISITFVHPWYEYSATLLGLYNVLAQIMLNILPKNCSTVHRIHLVLLQQLQLSLHALCTCLCTQPPQQATIITKYCNSFILYAKHMYNINEKYVTLTHTTTLIIGCLMMA